MDARRTAGGGGDLRAKGVGVVEGLPGVEGRDGRAAFELVRVAESEEDAHPDDETQDEGDGPPPHAVLELGGADADPILRDGLTVGVELLLGGGTEEGGLVGVFLVKFEDALLAHPGVGPVVVLGGAAGLVGGAAARLARGVVRAAAGPAVAARLATAAAAGRRSGLRLGVEDVGIGVHRRPRAGGRGGGVVPVGRRAAGRARARRTALGVVQGRALGARGVVGRPLLAALGHAQPHDGVPTGLPHSGAALGGERRKPILTATQARAFEPGGDMARVSS